MSERVRQQQGRIGRRRRRGLALSTVLATLVASLGLIALGASSAGATALGPFLDRQERGLHLSSDAHGLVGWDRNNKNLTVSVAGPVSFAYLYWAGEQNPCTLDSGGTSCPSNGEDQLMAFNGTPLAGTVRGTETQPTTGDGSGPAALHISYYADVTAIVGAAGTGTKSFAFTDGDTLSNLSTLQGVSLVVGSRDPADPHVHRVLISDGGDFADAAAPTAENRSTSAVTFNHGDSGTVQPADILVMTGGGTAAGTDNVTVSGNPTVSDGLNASDGAAWDLDHLSVAVNAATTTVQVNSGTAGPQPNLVPADPAPDPLFWIFTAMVIDPDPLPPTCTIQQAAPGHHTFTVQDPNSGLASIVVTRSDNADTAVPPFTVGTQDPVSVTSTRIDSSAIEHVTLTATDENGNSQDCGFAGPTISGTPHGGGVGEPYSFTFTTTGEPTPAVTKSAGTLPPGLTLADTGKLSGTPTRAGTYHFTVKADNGIDEPATKAATVVIKALPTLKVSDASTKEGNSGTHPLAFRVGMSRKSSVPVTVQWTTGNGSAVAPSDYVAAHGTLTFAPGQTSKTVPVQVKGDRVKEPSEVFYLLTLNPTHAHLVDPNGAGGIVNDD